MCYDGISIVYGRFRADVIPSLIRLLSALTAVLTVLPMRGILAATNDPSVPDLQPGWMMIGLLGGLALFLYGMDHLATALKTLAGARLRVILAKMTRNRFMAVLSGWRSPGWCNRRV